MRYIKYIPFIIREFFNGKNKDFSIEIKDEWDETLMKAEEYLEEKDIDADDSIEERQKDIPEENIDEMKYETEEPTNHRKSSALSKNLSVLSCISRSGMLYLHNLKI